MKNLILVLVLFLAGLCQAELTGYFTCDDNEPNNTVVNANYSSVGLTGASITTDNSDPNKNYTITITDPNWIGTAGNGWTYQASLNTDANPPYFVFEGNDITLYFRFLVKTGQLKNAWDSNDTATSFGTFERVADDVNASAVIFSQTNFSGGTDLVSVPHGTLYGQETVYDYNSLVYDSNSGEDIGCHQGIAWDGTYYYGIHTNAVKKYDTDWNLIASNSDVFAQARAILPESGSNTYNHLGDGAVYDDILYIPLQYWEGLPSDFNEQRIVRLRTSDLAVIGCNDISMNNHEAASAYVDEDYIYVVSYGAAKNKIHLYDRQTLLYDSNITLTTPLSLMQGITSNGSDFYITYNWQGLVARVGYDGTVKSEIAYDFPLTGAIEGLVWQEDSDRFAVLFDGTADTGIIHYLIYDIDTPAITTAQRSVEGKINGALNFNGTSDYIDTGQTFNDVLDSNFTVILWCKVPERSSQQFLLYISSGDGAENSRFFIRITEEAEGQMWDINYKTLTCETVDPYYPGNFYTLTNENWAMITVVMQHHSDTNKVEAKLYLNAIENTAGTQEAGTMSGFSSLNNLLIGSSGGTYLRGSIDDVRIYNRVLTDYEIAQLYFSGKGVTDYAEPNDVRAGVVYKVADVNLTGTLIVPAANDVRYGTIFDSNSTTGLLDLPLEKDVRYKTTFDSGTKTGTLVIKKPIGR